MFWMVELMKNRISILLVVLALAASGAFGDTLVLDPGSIPFDSTNIGTNVDRGDAFDALANFSILSAGIFFDPLDGGATEITANIYAVAKGSPVGTLGSLLKTASASVTDAGATFYDVSLAFDFTAGGRYYLAFTANGNDGWGSGINNMTFFNFDASGDSPFTVGDASVVDGGCFGGACIVSGFDNAVLPLIRLETAGAPTTAPDTSEIPEPSSASLAVMLLGGIGLGLWRKTARSR